MKTKVAIKNQNITAFGGIFQVEDLFNRLFSKLKDTSLGLRSPSGIGYQFSEVFCNVNSIYLCGGDHIEDITTYLGRDLKLRPNPSVASSDTISRALKSLACENTEYTSDAGIVYAYNDADKMNNLLLDMLMTTGQLKEGIEVTLDFDHEFIPAEKYDALYSYKKARGYFPGVATIGGLIVGIENRDGNANVKFHQSDTLSRFFTRLEKRNIDIANFRADCGSYSEDIIKVVLEHSKRFYLRASNCMSRLEAFEKHKDWRPVEINFEQLEVASFEFDDFMPEAGLRLVVQRQEIKNKDGIQNLFGKQYVYRAILTNDWEMREEDVIRFYNARGGSERNFDVQNNDFGWAHLPFSFMNKNTVFMLLTAMIKNFYLYLVSLLADLGVQDLKPTSRVKRLIFTFIVVPAKWIKTARAWTLNLYTNRTWYAKFNELT